MKKSVSLKELPGAYVPTSLTVAGLCEYLKISEQHIRKWEEFFSLTPDTKNGHDKAYSREVIKKFIKIKEHYDKGKPLKELKEKIAVLPVATVASVAPVKAVVSAEPAAPAELTVNPFEKPILSSKKMPELNIARLKKEKETVEETPASAALARPFLSQLNKVNLKVEKLLLEKARLIENTAIEKSRLITKIEVLKAKNAELEKEKDQLTISIAEKEQEVKKHFTQETVLSETLMITQEIFRKKEDEIRQLNSKIERYERELARKSALIQKQNVKIGEISALVERQNDSWWKFWKLRVM